MSTGKIFAALLLSFLFVSAFSCVVPPAAASSGYINVNGKLASAPNQQVQAGGNVNLYFGNVMWEQANEFALVLSNDNYPRLSVGDVVYTPTFSVANLTSTTIRTYTNENGAWTVGNNWINGTIIQYIPVGNYAIKAFDQVSATTAVTDVFIIIYSVVYSARLQASPASGPGGIPVQFSGSGFPPSSPVTISYLDPAFGSWNYLTSAVANSQGQISFSSQVPDLGQSLSSGDYSESYRQISYRAEIHGVVYCYVDYLQYSRGLKTVGTQTANGLFGNGTNLASSVNVKVGDSLTIAGRYFHPGVVYIRFDGSAIVGTVTGDQWRNAQIIGSAVANSVGSFQTTVTIPQASAGEHYLSIEDSVSKVITKIYVSYSTLNLAPSSGPGGVTVQFTGSGYPASTLIDIAYYDSAFDTWNLLGSTLSSSSGQIQYSSVMPDLGRSLGSSDGSETYTSISFRTMRQGTIFGYADYKEYVRGLKRVGNQVANGLYGNGTSLISQVSVNPGDSLTISGKWFHPGVVYVRWDSISVVGTVTGDQWRNAQIVGTAVANSVGSFDVSITVPAASAGSHYLSIEDSISKVIVSVMVAGPNPTPTQGPIQKFPSRLELACESTTSYIGFNVEIAGRLLAWEPVRGEPVFLLYSANGGTSWENLTLVYTGSDGRFLAVWMAPVSGNYLIQAIYYGNETIEGSNKTVSLVSTPFANLNVFSVTSNSTVSSLAFNSATNELSFSVTGSSGTNGFVEVSIAKNLITNMSSLQVYLDGVRTDFTLTSSDDSWIIRIQYSHSTHTVVVNLGQVSAITPSPSTSTAPPPTQSTPPPETPSTTPTPPQSSTPIATPLQSATPPTSPDASSTPEIPELPSVAIMLVIAALSMVDFLIAKTKREKR